MKTKLMIVLALSLVMMSGSLFAQIEPPTEPVIIVEDTLYVFPTYNGDAFDALNKWIDYGFSLDTPAKIFRLANNETYKVSHRIVTDKPLHIVALKPDAENAPPLVVAATDLNNEFPAFIIQNNGDITVKNIYFCGADIEEPVLGAATQSQYIIQSTMDSSTNIIDGCYFEWMGGDGAAFSTPANGVNLTFTNNMVFNCTSGGTAWWSTWAGYTVNMGNGNVGDIVVRNNTTFNCPGPFFISYMGLQKSVVIEHNTVINNAIYTLFNSTWTDAELKSNIFYNCSVQGIDIQMLQAVDSLDWGIVYVDTLSFYGADSAYAAMQGVDITEVEPLRKISLIDNYYGWSSEIHDYWARIIADTLYKEPVWMNPRVQAMFADDANYPLFTESNTFTKEQHGEPQFAGLYGTAATMDSLVGFLENVIGGGGTAPARYYYCPGEEDPQPNPAMVWPLQYNLAIENSALVGEDGLPLGDLNWYPEYAERWDPDVLISIAEAANALPVEFKLNQNFPNPFNPTTNISFYLQKKSEVKLIIYDILGQEVTTLVDGLKAAGRHRTVFDARGLASGLYFYKLETNDNVITKKMLLIK